MPDFQLERDLSSQGHSLIAGIDEAGRGSLFGPVVAAAVILPPEIFGRILPPWLEGVNDSKLLTPGRRAKLSRCILEGASAVGIGYADSREVDQMNIHRASLTAMARAVDNLTTTPDALLVDGFTLKDVHYPQVQVRQGDRKSVSIAAASIIAKVLRDEMMRTLGRIFEDFGLEKHKGYGTSEHFAALERMGRTPCHRLSFNLRRKAKKE